jgi:hypothetical protein
MYQVSFVLSEFSMSRSVIRYTFPLCNPWHVGRDRSNLDGEYRDEIHFEGVGCDVLGFYLASLTLAESNPLT